MADWLIPVILAVFFAADAALFTFFLLRTRPRPKPAMEPAPEPATTPGTIAGRLLVGAFGVAWVVGTMSCDYFVVNGAVRHYCAMAYDETEGTVVRCDLIVHTNEEGSTYHLDLDYVYRVGDLDYHGDRIRYYSMWGTSFLKQFVDAHPAGTRLSVYYDANEPAESVLLRGWDGGLLWGAMFLTPFNIVMMGILWIAVTVYRHGALPERPAFAVVENRHSMRIRLGHDTPRFAALMMFLLSSLLTAFGVACIFEMPPSVLTMLVAWCIVIAVPTFTYVVMSRGTAAGNFDLLVHPAQKSLTISKWVAWSGPFVIRFSDIAAIDVVAKTDHEGVGSHQVVIRWKSADGNRECRLGEYVDASHANELAALLRGLCFGMKS